MSTLTPPSPGVGSPSSLTPPPPPYTPLPTPGVDMSMPQPGPFPAPPSGAGPIMTLPGPFPGISGPLSDVYTGTLPPPPRYAPPETHSLPNPNEKPGQAPQIPSGAPGELLLAPVTITGPNPVKTPKSGSILNPASWGWFGWLTSGASVIAGFFLFRHVNPWKAGAEVAQNAISTTAKSAKSTATDAAKKATAAS